MAFLLLYYRSEFSIRKLLSVAAFSKGQIFDVEIFRTVTDFESFWHRAECEAEEERCESDGAERPNKAKEVFEHRLLF